jgi:putative nucleotidyltransferase with HDIG domain
MSEAIAKARNLPDENVEQIRMAAMIHDVGKIYVPAEFLNKPGVLSKIELAIIRMHAQIGHDILEPINFPFPIHKIILQHHERMDGSGYPLGLRGSEIMPESKIISVADVLEAISHHRPYRPALGKEEAMKEIQQRKGTKYDAEIVEAAQSVFAENLFRFD